MNLKSLIDTLAEEQKVHERLLQAKREERIQLALADAPRLLKNTERISDLVDRARDLEKRRLALIRDAAMQLGITQEPVTVKDILEVIPPANRPELEVASRTLKNTLEQIREANRTNHRILQDSIAAIRLQLKQFIPQQESGVYTAQGVQENPSPPRAGLNIRA